MREQIAVLDGLSGLGMSDPYVQDYSGYVSERSITPVPGNGQNYTGGSDWFPGAPTSLQQEGLANLNGLGMDPYGYAGETVGPVPGGGQNYGGGSSWAPGFPTMPSSEGLASGLSVEEVPGYAGSRYTPVPGGGANYTGGSDWFPGAPTSVSSQGLVGLARLRDVDPVAVREWATCGVWVAARLLGQPREWAARMSRTVYALGFPRRVPLNRDSVAYMAAYYAASRSGIAAKHWRSVALRAVTECAPTPLVPLR